MSLYLVWFSSLIFSSSWSSLNCFLYQISPVLFTLVAKIQNMPPKSEESRRGPGSPRLAWPLVRVHGSVLVSILMYFPLMFVYSFFILGGEELVFF